MAVVFCRWVSETTGSAPSTIGRFVLGPRQGSKHFLPCEEASPSCGESPNHGKTRAGEIHRVTLRVPPRSPPSSTLVLHRGVGNSDRSAILSAANIRELTCGKTRGGWRGLYLYLARKNFLKQKFLCLLWILIVRETRALKEYFVWAGYSVRIWDILFTIAFFFFF